MRKIINLTTDLCEEDLYKKFTVKQYDDVELHIKVLDKGLIYNTEGQTIKFYCRKNDGTILYQTDGITNNDNKIIIKLKNQSTTCPGSVYAELELCDENGTISTGTFTYFVSEKVGRVENALESIDEIYILEEIENFIKQSKEDIALYKQSVIELQEIVLATSTQVDEFNSTIESKKQQAISDLTNTQETSINELNTLKTSIINDMSSTKDIALNEMTTNKTNALEEINLNKTGAVEEINANKGIITTMLESAKNETLQYVEEVKTTTQTNAEIFNQLKIDIEALNNIALSTKTELETVKNASSTLKTELENVKQASSTVLTDLTNKTQEAITVKDSFDGALDSLMLAIGQANIRIQELENANIQAGEKLLELAPVNTEADLNIEELKALITEAKEIAIPALKAYIAEHTPAEDLTEVNKQLEELYNAVQELDIRFNSYYTKAEIDEKISNIDLTPYAKKDEVDASLLNKVDKVEGKGLSQNDFTDSLKSKLEGLDTIKGVIGAGEKIATPPIGMFDNIPEPPEKSGAEYIGKIMYKAGDYYYVLYMYNTEKYNPYLYVDTSTTNAILIRENQFGTSYNTLVGYRRTTISESWTATAYASIYPEFKTYGIYHLDLPIYSDKNKTGIYRHPTTNETISNLDLITEPGDYLLNATVSNYNNIQNMPPVKLKNDLETILKCYKKDNNVYQELVIEGITYNRKVGDLWIYNKHNDCVKKEIIAEIKNKEITVFSVLPDIYSTCPKPNLSCDITGEIAFKRNDGLYAMWYVTTKINNPMFYNYSDKYLGYTGAYQNLIKYNYQNGAWTEDTGTSINTTITTGKFEIYKNTLPVCKGTSSTAYDKNTILKEATTDEEEKTLNSFNLATDVGTYKVEITEVGGIESSPVVGAITGVLIVSKAKDLLYHRLITVDNKQYTRVYNGTEWTVWNEEGTSSGNIDIDLSSYYTKVETDNKIDEKIALIDIPKLDDYYNKIETENKINEKVNSIEIPNLDNYYTKDEIDALKMENNASGGYIGFIGESSLPDCYGNIPKPKAEVQQELWMKNKDGNYMVVYVYKPSGNGVQIYLSSSLSFIRIDMASGGYGDVYEAYKYNGAEWTMTTDATTIYINGSELTEAKKSIYYCNADIKDYSTSIVKIPAMDEKPAIEGYGDFNSATKQGTYNILQGSIKIGNSPIDKPFAGMLSVETAKQYIQQRITTTDKEKYARLYDGEVWSSWTRLSVEDIETKQTTPGGVEVLTPSLFSVNQEQLRFEYGEYIVDTAKNSPHVADNTREYTDVIYLKQGGFKKILGCTVSPNRVDFHYSMWTNINMLLVDETVIPDCMRLYMSYNPPEKLWKGDAWNPTTGIQKIKYCVIGY